MTQEPEKRGTGLHRHERDIHCDKAGYRIIYATGYGLQPSGWHAPGPLFTADRAEAVRWAERIDALITQSRATALPVATNHQER